MQDRPREGSFTAVAKGTSDPALTDRAFELQQIDLIRLSHIEMTEFNFVTGDRCVSSRQILNFSVPPSFFVPLFAFVNAFLHNLLPNPVPAVIKMKLIVMEELRLGDGFATPNGSWKFATLSTKHR